MSDIFSIYIIICLDIICFSVGYIIGMMSHKDDIPKTRSFFAKNTDKIEHQLSTHSAIATRENTFANLSMNTAINMNADGSPLTSNSALKGPDAAKW